MKSIFLLLLFSASSFSLKEEFFTGTIYYTYTYTDKGGKNINEKFDYHKTIYRFSATGYEGLTIGKDKDTLIYYYNSKTNTCFSKRSGPYVYTCTDYGISNTYSKVYTKKESAKIKGHDCIIVYGESADCKAKHYYSKKMKINPIMYANHKAFQWNELMEAAQGGLVLRSEFEYSDYRLVMEFDSFNNGIVNKSMYDNKCQ